MGSAKDVNFYDNKTGFFRFRDDFSVLDLVAAYEIKMASQIRGKGLALWRMAKKTFELLAAEGIPTHYVGAPLEGVIDFYFAKVYDCHIRRGGEPIKGPKFTVDFNYNIPANETCFVIPLEVIGRNELGPDSSIMKMAIKGEVKPEDVGLEKFSTDGKLPHPITTYTTKYEKGDKFLTRAQALALSGLTLEQFNKLETLEKKVQNALDVHAGNISERYAIDFSHPDGKREWIFSNGELMVGDVAGTLDEDRFEIRLDDGTVLKLSKQILRDWMASTTWYQEKFLPWKNQLKVPEKWTVEQPPAVPAELLEYVMKVYDVGSRMWTMEAEPAEVEDLIAYFKRLREASIIK